MIGDKKHNPLQIYLNKINGGSMCIYHNDGEINNEFINTAIVQEYARLSEENRRLREENEKLKKNHCLIAYKYEVIEDLNESIVGIYDNDNRLWVSKLSINGNSPYTFKEAREILEEECEKLNEEYTFND